MEDRSVFPEKEHQPTDSDLKEKLGETIEFWERINEMVNERYPEANPEWNFPGQKYGWSFRIKVKKRAIIYLLPRQGFFMAAFVFGDRAVEKIVRSNVAPFIKEELLQAKKYAEGRGIRIDVRSGDILMDIEELITIKLDT